MKTEGTSLSGTGEPVGNFSIHIKNSTICIIVIHEVWGPNLHTKGVCKRLSKFGYSSIAPNLYSGNKRLFTFKNIRQAMAGVWDLSLKERYDREKVMRVLEQQHASKEVVELTTTLYSKGFREKMLSDLTSCAHYAASRYGKLAAIGFSMGGGLSLKLAARFPKLRACVSFCGEPPEPEEIYKIRAPILAIYGGQDEFMNSRVPDFVYYALKRKNDLTVRIYGRARHEFFNEKNKHVYNRELAEDSWKITQNFLEEALA